MDRSIYKIYKRLTAILLMLCMSVGLVFGQSTLTAYATQPTELTNEDLGEGRSEGTAYTWKYDDVTGQEPSGKSYRFDLRGLESGQNSYSNAGIKTTYRNGGYASYIQVGSSSKRVLGTASNLTNGGVEVLSAEQVEVKISVTPSPDNRYIFVDYYVYDTSGEGGSTGRPVKLGTATDVMIGGSTEDDNAAIYKNERGFHMVNRHVLTVFDCITNDERLGVTPPDTRWIGNYSASGRNVFNESTANSILPNENIDSGLAYSWHFNLRPYEVVHKRVAFAIRDTSYYVSDSRGHDDSSASGTYSSPFRTIGYALQKLQGRKGYIYVMDYPDITAPIAVSGSSNMDITIASTDYDANGTPVVGKDGYIKTLRRGAGYTGSLFTVSGATLKLSDIVLDGNQVASDSPIIAAESGRLELNSGSVIRNANGSETSQGSAVSVTGTAALSMNFGTVTGNVSAGKGAVYYNSSGAFELRNVNTIQDNTTPQGGKSNVYLAEGKVITVMNTPGDSDIGVTTQTRPAGSLGGEVTADNQEVVVAVPDAGYPGLQDFSPFVDNFKADQAPDGFYINEGSRSRNNAQKTVLKRTAYTLSRVYQDMNTGGSVVGAPAAQSDVYGGGDEVNVAAPAAIAGYTLENITVEQGTGTTLSAVTDKNSADFGKVSGIMPSQEVVVTYQYVRKRGSIAFQANGGAPAPSTLTGAVGERVNGLLPTLSRYGYTFEGWSRVNDREHPDLITELPRVFPESPLTYYAIFTPDSSVKFDYAVNYVNADGSIVFQSVLRRNAYSAESEIDSAKKPVHGYVWSKADSSLSPERFDYTDGRGPVPIGSFADNGRFTGKMPGEMASVKFTYRVDRNNPDARSEFRVKYKTASGTAVHADDVRSVFPEDAITAAPVDVYGFRLLRGEITRGQTADDADDHLVSAVQGSFDANQNFSGSMPNQPVELVYWYEPTGENYEYRRNYLDNGTRDERLRNIMNPERESVRADTQLNAPYKNLYGYLFQAESANPATAGSFDAQHNFTGIMPNDNLSLTHRYDRDASKWAELTYKAGTHGTLRMGQDTSPDVTAASGGGYKASVLFDDGTAEGAAGSYTWKVIRDKRLAPEAAADRYYRLGGWFIDQNNNGTLDGSESLLTDDSRFTGPTTVTAYFEEEPSQWIDIHLAAGEHGTINAGEATSIHAPYDYTWGDVRTQLPAYTPEANYLVDGWYLGTEPAQADGTLVSGATYTIHFYPDPAVFGTNVSPRDALAGIDTRGKGRMTVYGTTQGYKYIITDLDGNIVDVTRGNVSDRVYFENLYPEKRYLVYEATGNTQAEPGQPIGSARGILSTPTEVLVPTVETNYQVLYDDVNEGKTVLEIKPADADSDYAILDTAGNVVATPEAAGWQSVTGGQPASLRFSNLDYNGNYVVVARPRGEAAITPESKFADGTQLTMVPGGELEIPNFIVETINGQVHTVAGETVDAARYETAHKDDEVVLHADATDANGHRFLYWKLTAGTVPGMAETVNTQDLTFTMPDSNVVLTAYYHRPAAVPSNASVADEVRGGGRHEMALDPDEIEGLEEQLTTEADRVLMDVNRANVRYNVVYSKNAVRATESEAIQSSAYYNTEHETAYHGAWGLNVDIERYVNGRKVGRATPSDATFSTYVQLDKGDVDMMDYQLFSVTEDQNDGTVSVEPVAMSDDPEETGGLFTFTAQAGKRYVLIYSRAYRIYFIDNTAETKYRYYYKVRRGEAPSDDSYADEYAQVLTPESHFVNAEGVEFNYLGWSYRQDRLRDFDPTRAIERKTYVYAYYEDNSDNVDDARKRLEDAINAALKKADDPFLTRSETAQFKAAIEEAMDVFDRTAPRAPLAELLDALARLNAKSEPFDNILADRYGHYGRIRESGNQGGISGSDGWGSGDRTNGGAARQGRNTNAGGSGNAGSGSTGGSGSNAGPGTGSGSGSAARSTGGSGGSGSGGSGGSGSGRSAGSFRPLSVGGPIATPKPYVADLAQSYVVGTNGRWELIDLNSGKWAFVLNGGIRLTSIWAKLDYAHNDDNRNGWYHFNAGGLMDFGWFRDENKDWYFCNATHDGWLGKMETGWHYDKDDKHWYYLEPETGRMVTGWKQIDGKWYYFTERNGGATYIFDRRTEKWVFVNNQEKPVGSMFAGEMTPDGYHVGADGAYRE